MADTRPQPSAEPVAIFQAARRAWLAGPTIVRDPETHSVRIGDKEAAAAVIASALEAARREALEQAAKVCDEYERDRDARAYEQRQAGKDDNFNCANAAAAARLATAIRALKENTNG